MAAQAQLWAWATPKVTKLPDFTPRAMGGMRGCRAMLWDGGAWLRALAFMRVWGAHALPFYLHSPSRWAGASESRLQLHSRENFPAQNPLAEWSRGLV